MTKEDALLLVRRLHDVDGTEKELDRILLYLEDALPNSRLGNMMYICKTQRTCEEIVEEAFRRAEAPKLALPPPKS